MMDHEKIKEGVRLMLEGIGEDVNREGLLETPDRIARMCEQIYGGLYEDAGVHLRSMEKTGKAGYSDFRYEDSLYRSGSW